MVRIFCQSPGELCVKIHFVITIFRRVGLVLELTGGIRMSFVWELVCHVKMYAGQLV